MIFSPDNLKSHFSSINAAFSLFHEIVFLFLARFKQKSNPMGIMIHREIGQPGSSIGIDANFITWNVFLKKYVIIFCNIFAYFFDIFVYIPAFKPSTMVVPAIEFLWLSLWFWSKTEATSSPFKRIDRRAFLLSWVAI